MIIFFKDSAIYFLIILLGRVYLIKRFFIIYLVFLSFLLEKPVILDFKFYKFLAFPQKFD